MKELKNTELFDLSRTLAKPLFQQTTYPWEVLPLIGGFVAELGKTLTAHDYHEVETGVWVHRTASVSRTASIAAPCIICEGAKVSHCALIRGNVIVGKNAEVGNSSEIKNAILFDNAHAPHFNYVGDSIMGYLSHIGAGVILSNLKSDKSSVSVAANGEKISTGLRKFGAALGDSTEVGCNSVLGPGAVTGKNVAVYPLSHVRGFVPSERIFKSKDNIVEKH
ncbi:MAG: UDP-N-acetylglucosamine pyrophosphorylase [Oscillospiraceae bacterium]|jgi:NDP-sugar pyrophosphorylase family protein|nr:UDP-N-acetylglucosamine pyrophosphorylase [Oscillospiraceae bacterium]